jgi:hypothetical protein
MEIFAKRLIPTFKMFTHLKYDEIQDCPKFTMVIRRLCQSIREIHEIDLRTPNVFVDALHAAVFHPDADWEEMHGAQPKYPLCALHMFVVLMCRGNSDSSHALIHMESALDEFNSEDMTPDKSTMIRAVGELLIITFLALIRQPSWHREVIEFGKTWNSAAVSLPSWTFTVDNEGRVVLQCLPNDETFCANFDGSRSDEPLKIQIVAGANSAIQLYNHYTRRFHYIDEVD